MEARKTTLIMNPLAGKGEAKSRVATAMSYLQPHFTQDLECFSVDHRKSLADTIRTTAENGTELLIICGGDGTLSLTAHELHRQALLDSVTIGYLPFGDYTDFGPAVGVPTDFRQALDILIQGKTTHIDLWEIKLHDAKGGTTERVFINHATLGFPAATVDRSNKFPPVLEGPMRTIAAGIAVLPTWKSQLLELRCDASREPVKGAFFGMAFCSGFQSACGLRWLSEKRAPTQKALEIVGLREASRMELAKQFQEAYKGSALETVKTAFRGRSDAISVHSFGPIAVECDGDLVGFSPFQIARSRKSLKIITAL